MTPPAVAAARFGWACLLGLGLGLCYEFLRPLRPRHTTLSDSLFLLATLTAAVYFSFAVCRGDIRIGSASGMALGGFLWAKGPGRLLRPMMAGIWKILGRIRHFFTLPVKNFLNFGKNMFASAEKWVTIRWNNRRQNRRVTGGVTHGRKQPFPDRPAQEQPRHQDRGIGGYRVVYPGADRTAVGHE